MEAFYAAALQDEASEFVFDMELVLTDTNEAENRYSVTFNVAPKGDYVERELALKEIEPEEEEEEEPEPEPVEEEAVATTGSTFDAFSLFKKPKRKARKNMPVEVLVYDDPGAMFEKVEPTLRKMNIDKKGVNQINFSGEMQYPDNWIAKHDSYLDEQDVPADEELRRRLRGGVRRLEGVADQPFVRVLSKNAATGVLTEVDPSA